MAIIVVCPIAIIVVNMFATSCNAKQLPYISFDFNDCASELKFTMRIFSTHISSTVSSQESVIGWRRRLNGSTILLQAPTSDTKLAARGYCIVASLVLHRGQPGRG